MGVLSDLIVAPASAAEAISRSQVPAQEFGGADIKGIDTIKLARLHAQLTGDPLEALLPAYDPLVSVSDDGPWVFALPSRFVQQLATLGAPERAAAGARWAQAEEFTLDGWASSEVHGVLETLCAAARQAQGAGDALFLWMAL